MAVSGQRICLWLTVVFGAAMVVVVVTFPGFFPPMSPSASAQQVAAFYRDHAGGIRVSMITFNLFGVLLVPFFMLIVTQIMRMAHPSGALAFSYLGAVASSVTLFALADLAWLVAAFRPDRDPQIVQMLNDIAWLTFVAPVGPFIASALLLAVAVRLDAGATPVFPHWVTPFNVVAAVLMAPGALAVVFRSGPFAWNGLLAFWVHFGALAGYLVVMVAVLWKVVDRQIAAEPAEPALVEVSA